LEPRRSSRFREASVIRTGGQIMNSKEITCVVTPLSQMYANGLQRVELYVCTESIPSVETPRPGERVIITFSTRLGDYQGGLRNNLDQYPYVCPDLRTKLGDKTNLATVIRDNGVKPHDRVRVSISGKTWTLLGVA
jgi:hypothetical protein